MHIMKLYIAKVLIKSTVDGDLSGEIMCDEQIHIIRAIDAEVAYKKALKIGLDEEHSYENADDNIVHWFFVGLIDLEEILESENDGNIEITNRIFRNDSPSLLVVPKEQLSVFQIN